MSDVIAVHSATIDDAEQLAAAEQAAAAHPWSLSSVRSALASEGGHALIATRDGARLGHLLGHLVLDEAELWSVATLPHARRAGVGRALLRHAQHHWRARGATVAHLEVREDNGPARALYEDEGWEQVGRRRGYYPDGHDAILYRLDLTRGRDALGPP
jgi:ribosomal-protein-alanine N-acetyltransferase